MRRWAVVLTIVAAVSCGGGDDASEGQLPDVELASLDGSEPPLRLAEMTGPAVINLWATWCAPCRRELPAFQTVSEERSDVAFIGVDIGEDAADARAFLGDIGVTFPQYADREAALTDALGTAALPVTLVVNGTGQIATTHVGPMSVEELTAAIDDVDG